MIKTRFKKAYNAKGKPNFPDLRAKSGVYLIQNPKGVIVYVGYSGTDLYKTMYRHFQRWNDETQVRATFDKRRAYKVRVVLVSPVKAVRLEKALILKYKPTKNHYKYKGFILKPSEEKVEEEYFEIDPTNFDDLPF